MADDGSARDRLAVALDVASLDEAAALVERLGDVPGWLKVGSELFTAAGPPALALAGAHARVFLDIKLHDIPNTVARATAAATRHGVGMLTLHAAGGVAMLRAARAAAQEAAERWGRDRPALLAVTVLTSLGEKDLEEVGGRGPVEDQVARLAALALEAGLDGVVASPREIARVRREAGDALRIVVPGIRSAAASEDDQARSASAGAAVRAGADLLVVGRPISRASDPAGAARALLTEIAQALDAPTG